MFDTHFIRQFIKELLLKIIHEEINKLDKGILRNDGNTSFDISQPIHGTLDKTHDNYTLTNEEFLIVTSLSKRFKQHVIDSKIKVYINYGSLRKITLKIMDKIRTIYWVILLQKPKLQVVQRKKKPPDELGRFVLIGHTSSTNAFTGGTHRPSLGENPASPIEVIEEIQGLNYVCTHILIFGDDFEFLFCFQF